MLLPTLELRRRIQFRQHIVNKRSRWAPVHHLNLDTGLLSDALAHEGRLDEDTDCRMRQEWHDTYAAYDELFCR